MVVDSSALLAVLFDEEGAAWAADQMDRRLGELRMSTVNLAEVLIHVADRNPRRLRELEARILGSCIRFVPPDADQACVAAQARLRFPLNLGDCFAYALAVAEGCPILTLDRDFLAVDVDVIIPEAGSREPAHPRGVGRAGSRSSRRYRKHEG